jgi:PqqD family protein of HPr-rel-A system
VTRPIRPQTRQDLAVVVLDGEAVVYDEDSGGLHHLNPTATIVFQLCDGTTTVREMSSEISEVFGIPADDVEREVRALLRGLRRSGLMDGKRTGQNGG